MTAQVTVNGEEVVLDGPETLLGVVNRSLDARSPSGGRGIAVAVNNDVVPRAHWATTTVHAGDRIEILTATQGG